MRHRHPLPRIWLMTDERIGDLEGAIGRLPMGSGIVFRYYTFDRGVRRKLFRRVHALARRRHHVLLLADHPAVARAWKADGTHNRLEYRQTGLRSASVHNLIELRAAIRAGADLVFVSPVFSTRSHPGSRSLGRKGLALLASKAPMPVIALGGMDAKKAKSLIKVKIHGWAAIDAHDPS